MSKKAKSRSKMRREARKAGIKAVRKAQYKSWAAEGITKGSKRSKLRRSRTRKVRTSRHNTTMCGNVGCKRCFPNL